MSVFLRAMTDLVFHVFPLQNFFPAVFERFSTLIENVFVPVR